MSDLTYGQGVILGVVQGLTEFLPISSSAHLALAQRWMDVSPNSPTTLLFDGLTHIGTVLSLLIVFARSFVAYVRRFVSELRPGWSRRRYACRIAWLGIVASIPTAVIGLGLKDEFAEAFDQPRRVGVGLLVTGVLLVITSVIPRGRRGWRRFTWWQAGLVGLAQGVAIEPGISRSGSTICTAAFCGLRRRWAAEFSFFIAIPAILGATALQLKDTLEGMDPAQTALAWGPMLAGSAVSLVVGVYALKLLLLATRWAKLHYFAWYCGALGALMAAGVV
ncbi:MAG: undecaprenyl-diphosphate phosphatase [Planctomycetes bacterium]|nr:undecaprenyl-diphosphate phosphatase [Planctomycetota bacterium]